MGQLSGILATLPELVKETVSSLKWLLCKEGKTLATIAKCLLLFKKLLDMKLKCVIGTKLLCTVILPDRVGFLLFG